MEGCNDFSDITKTPTFFFEVTGEQMWTLVLQEVHAELFEQMEFPYIYAAVAEFESGCCN